MKHARLARPLRSTSLKPTIVEIVVALLLALCFSIASEYAITTSIVSWADVLLRFATLALLMLVALVASRRFLSWLSSAEVGGLLERVQSFFASKSSGRAVLTLGAAIAVCWLPYLILMFPGNLSNDTTGQLAMFFSYMRGDGVYPMTDHHPLFDTLVFGGIVYPFELTGHFRIGVFVLVLLQVVVTALVFAFSIVFANRRWFDSGSALPPVLAALFVMFCPLIPLVVCSLSKDTFFSWTYALTLFYVADYLVTSQPLLRRPAHIVVFVITVILMALTKKLGFYVAAVMLLAVVLHSLVTKKRSCLAAFIAGFVTLLLAQFALVPVTIQACGAYPGHKSEMLSIPMLQIALNYERHPDAYNEQDLHYVSQMINLAAISNYDARIVDTVKTQEVFSPDFPTSEYAGFMQVWLARGLEYPADYLDAYAAFTAPLFGFDCIQPVFDSSWHSWNSDYLPEDCFEKSGFNEWWSNTLRGWYNWLCGLPVVNVLFMQSTYALFVPAALFCWICAQRGRRDRLVILVPIIVSLAGLLVGPTLAANNETMRYLLPFVYTTPTLFAFACSKCFNQSRQIRSNCE